MASSFLKNLNTIFFSVISKYKEITFVFLWCSSSKNNINSKIYIITCNYILSLLRYAVSKEIYLAGRVYYATFFIVKSYVGTTLKAETFAGRKLFAFFRVFWPFFAKVYAFGNSKAAKRESFFFTRNHRFFQKRESYFKRWKTLFSANLKAFHETYKNIAIEDVQVGLQLTRLKPIHAAWLIEFLQTIWPLQKGKKIIDGGWKASGISDASKLGSQKIAIYRSLPWNWPNGLGDNADQAADDNSHLLPVCDVTVEEFELLCGGKIQRELTDYETDDDSEWEEEEKLVYLYIIYIMLVMKMKNNEIEKNILLLTRKFFHAKMKLFFLIRESFFPRNLSPKFTKRESFCQKFRVFFGTRKFLPAKVFCFLK